MHLTLMKPPQDPFSLEEAKTFLKISSDDEDQLVKSIMSAATTHVENFTGRSLLKQVWELTLTPPYPTFSPLVYVKEKALAVHLPRPPLLEVTSVKVAKKPWEFKVEDNRLTLPSHLWNTEIKITYIAGYGDSAESLPADLKMALLIIMRNLYEGEPKNLTLLHPYKIFRLH
jgi:uncharacterized phiE125 gp8 family phage protein